jgi:glycosyltransferase involved in cell wall biosynthesis
MYKKVTIGLCVKNAESIIGTAFGTISIQDYPHEFLKLVIVDDKSTDNTLSLALKFAQETDINTFVTSNKGAGLGFGRNTALDNAEGDYIVWVDDDLVLTKDAVRNHVEFMEKHPNVAGAAGIPSLTLRPYETIIDMLEQVGLGLFPPNPQAIGTAGSIYRLEAVKKVHGFDVNIKGAGEDNDLSYRLRKSGWELAANFSVEIYSKYLPATPKSLWRRHFGYGYGMHFIFHKRNDWRILMSYALPFVILGSLKFSNKVYSLTHEKKVFLLVFHNIFTGIAQFFGFVRANIDGYGHNLEG